MGKSNPIAWQLILDGLADAKKAGILPLRSDAIEPLRRCIAGETMGNGTFMAALDSMHYDPRCPVRVDRTGSSRDGTVRGWSVSMW